MQLSLPIYTEFELITAEQLLPFKIHKKEKESQESLNKRVDELFNSNEYMIEVKKLCDKWNSQRKQKQLREWL